MDVSELSDETVMIDNNAILAAAFEEFRFRNGTKATKRKFYNALYALKDRTTESEDYRYETFTKCFNGLWPEENEIVDLLLLIIESWEITVEELVQKSYAENAIYGPSQPIDKVYTGAWLAIQFRTKKTKVTNDPPPNEYRIGLLIYGDTVKGERRFTEIGVSTIWTGEMYRRGPLFHFKSFERGRGLVFEKLNFITRGVLATSPKKFQYGMRFGSSFDEFSQPMLFASLLLLWKVSQLDSLKAPLTSGDVKKFRSICSYIAVGAKLDKSAFGELSDDVEAAINLFRDLNAMHNQEAVTFIAGS